MNKIEVNTKSYMYYLTKYNREYQDFLNKMPIFDSNNEEEIFKMSLMAFDFWNDRMPIVSQLKNLKPRSASRAKVCMDAIKLLQKKIDEHLKQIR